MVLDYTWERREELIRAVYRESDEKLNWSIKINRRGM